jgi:hypothetical protein
MLCMCVTGFCIHGIHAVLCGADGPSTPADGIIAVRPTALQPSGGDARIMAMAITAAIDLSLLRRRRRRCFVVHKKAVVHRLAIVRFFASTRGLFHS